MRFPWECQFLPMATMSGNTQGDDVSNSYTLHSRSCYGSFLEVPLSIFQGPLEPVSGPTM